MTKRSTTEEFISSARTIHGEKYCYEKSLYEKNNIKLTITCRDHGDFLQSPNSHLRGCGCRVCGLETKIAGRRKTLDQFICQAKEVHGEFYTYEKTEYKSANTKMCITCPDHGDFLISPDCFIAGQRCYECSLIVRGMKRRKPLEDFLADARIKHGYKYSYVPESYKDSSTKMTIICPDHGAFEQIPKSHLSGRGCADCAETGFNPEKPANVYCLKSDDGAFLKVGITGNIRVRMADLKCRTPFKFKEVGKIETEGFKARKIEKDVHSRFESAGLSGFSGCTEWLKYNEEILEMFQ